MADYRNDKLEYIEAKDKITVLKGGLFICEIANSKEFKEVLCGNFHPFTGLKGDTLIALGEFVNKLESARKNK